MKTERVCPSLRNNDTMERFLIERELYKSTIYCNALPKEAERRLLKKDVIEDLITQARQKRGTK